MKVRDVMTSDVGFCQPDSSLTQAAVIMWQRDCGVVPVVDQNQKIVGMITDRDICIAVASQNRLASEIKVSEVTYGKIRACSPSDDVEDALKIMKKRQLRRLPVVNAEGVLVGILSIADLLRSAGKGKDKISRKKLLAALQEISHLRPIQLHILNKEEAGDESEERNSDDERDEEEADESGEENDSDEDDDDEDDEDDDSDEDDDDDESDDDEEESDDEERDN